MRLVRTNFALEEINSFLSTAHRSTLVESYLVQYLLVALYAEIEEHVKAIISEKIRSVSERKVAHFINRAHEAIFKRIKKSDINDVLIRFGCGSGDVLSALVGDLNLQPYHDIIANRHLVSHQQGTNMTLSQVSAALPVAEEVLRVLHDTLFIDGGSEQ